MRSDVGQIVIGKRHKGWLYRFSVDEDIGSSEKQFETSTKWMSPNRILSLA